MTFKDQAAEPAIVSNSLPSGQITPVKIQLTDTTLSHGSNKAYSDYSEPTILQSILSGGVGGALMVIVGHPLDLLKVRHQALPSSSAHGKNTGKGSLGLINMFLELKMIVKRQGYRGLYRGLLTPLCAVAPTFAVEYGAFELFQSNIRSQSGKSTDQKLSIWEVAAAGGLSAVPATLLVAPAERIKCLVQVSGESEKSQGSLRQAWKKAGGIKGLYTGTLATLLRDSPGAAAYFTTYHVFKRLLTSESTPPSPFAIMFAGGLAGMANWVVAIVSMSPGIC
ncbi:carnitine transporter [Entomophthora muscae]|uniref:Carnitine transporter n=1 Tax=Entomophthora muscae TaxID=34485 RepID=A0ACC2UE75_9FUNG|nr:carnitine transporter [Entomophthora muscae]